MNLTTIAYLFAALFVVLAILSVVLLRPVLKAAAADGDPATTKLALKQVKGFLVALVPLLSAGGILGVLVTNQKVVAEETADTAQTDYRACNIERSDLLVTSQAYQDTVIRFRQELAAAPRLPNGTIQLEPSQLRVLNQ